MGAQLKSWDKTKGFLSNCAHLFVSYFISPKSEDLNLKQREFVLNIILVSVLLLTIILDVVVFFVSLAEGGAHSGISFTNFSIIVLIFGSFLLLSRKGYSYISSYGLVLLLFIANSYAAMQWGVGLPTALLGYALVIMISALIISRTFSLIAAGVVAVTVVVIGKLQIDGVIKYDANWGLSTQKLYDVVEYSLLLLLITVVSMLSSREIANSLKRARESEAALKIERDQLEIKVEERTAEIRKMEIEKMSQVYKITEFGRLSAGLFHDLVNSLNVVSLYIERLKILDKPEIKGELKRVFDATHRLDDFIQAIRKQMKNQEMEKMFFPVEEIQHVIDILAFKARVRRVDIIFKAKSDPSTFGNSLKFFQVVSNLVSNAIDSFVNLGEDERGKINIDLNSDGEYIFLEIKDNGCGIKEEDIPKIFDAFFSTKKAENGIGIGLTTVKEIVEDKFFGSISVQSQLGVGTTFSVKIPLQKDVEQGN